MPTLVKGHEYQRCSFRQRNQASQCQPVLDATKIELCHPVHSAYRHRLTTVTPSFIMRSSSTVRRVDLLLPNDDQPIAAFNA